MPKLTPVAKARKMALLTQSEMGNLLGVSVVTMSQMEREPENMTMAQISKVYEAVGVDGKNEIKKYVDSFFA